MEDYFLMSSVNGVHVPGFAVCVSKSNILDGADQ